MLIRLTNFDTHLDEDTTAIQIRLANLFDINRDAISDIQIVRRTIDARKRSTVHFVCSIECQVSETPELPTQASIIQQSSLITPKPAELSQSTHTQHTIIVGAGPAGLFEVPGTQYLII